MTDIEYQSHCHERNARFEAKHGRPMTYEDVIKSFGGRFCGESQIDSNWHGNKCSEDDGVR